MVEDQDLFLSPGAETEGLKGNVGKLRLKTVE